jgi:23S rRNA (adenine2503-C2)-methyltransferase
MNKIDIRTKDLPFIKTWFSDNSEKSFRAKQVWEWLYEKSAFSFDDMTNLSVSLRDKLKENFVINPVRVRD